MGHRERLRDDLARQPAGQWVSLRCSVRCPCGEAAPAQPWAPEDRKVLLRYLGARGRSFQLVTQQMLEGFWCLGLTDETQPPLKGHKQTVPIFSIKPRIQSHVTHWPHSDLELQRNVAAPRLHLHMTPHSLGRLITDPVGVTHAGITVTAMLPSSLHVGLHLLICPIGMPPASESCREDYRSSAIQRTQHSTLEQSKIADKCEL